MKAKNVAQLTFTSTITLSEVEIRALDAIVGYGDDAFLKVFKEQLGQAYIRDHEAGLRSFFDTVRSEVLGAIRDIDVARSDLQKALVKRHADRLRKEAEAASEVTA